MTQNTPQIKFAKRAEQAVQARRAPTAKQAKRAEQAAKAINLEELSKTRIEQNGTTTFLANYNDPTELNSFIDALTNREAVSKKFGDTWGTISTLSGTVSTLAWIGAAIAAVIPGGQPVAAGLATAATVAATPAIPAALDVLYEKGLKPIAAGKPQEAGLNLLMNIGETMDFAANPVKGFVIDGPEGFTKAMGLAEGGRVNYDYDTGNFITDMLLELISDPMNWLDFGTGQALKSGLKTVGKNTAVKNGVDGLVNAVNKKFASSVGEITIEGSARISDAITKTTTSVARDFAEATADNYTRRAKKLAKQAGQYWEGLQETERANLRKLAKEQLLREGQTRTQRSIVQAIQKELPKADAQQIHLILKQANIETAASKQARTMYDLVAENITYDKLSSDIVKQMAAARHYSDTAQKFFTKGAMLTSGYGLGVEAAKNGWYGIRAWANNLTLQKLKKATVFDNLKGLDIKQWKTAKGIWEATYKYTTDLQGNVSQRDMNSFYTFAAQQFNRDRQLLSLIMQDSADPLKIAPKLEAQVKEIYGFNSFDEYINCVKNINADENNIFANYVAYLENIRTTINSNAFAKYATGANIKTSDALFSIKQVAADNVIARIQDAIKQSKTGIELTDKLYALKLNNAYVTAMLARNPVISEVMNKIASSEQIGALFKKLIEHPDALNPNVSALVRPTIEYVQMSGKSFVNIKEFMNNIAQLPIQKIQKINTTNFKQYIIDQILNGSPKTAAELFDNFDNTFASFKNGLETMLSDKGFKFKDYPALEDQIKGVYYQFLEKQVADNVERINIIAEDFTKSVEFLIQSFPEFNEQLLELASANDIIKTTLHQVKLLGGDLLDAVFTDKNTLFKVAKANTRRLSEVGLAIKTIDLTETHKMFDIPQGATSAVLQNISRVGASIKRINEKLMQYNVCFDAKVTHKITAAYKEVRQKMMQNASYEKTAFSYLKEVTDPVEQFAVLAEYYKYIKASEVDEVEFKKLLSKHLPTKEYLNVLDPSPLLTTDFAWDAMAESAYKAEKIFNENIINSITAYRNLGLASRKITGDFYAMREVLSTNKLDRPKLLQQERYIKFAEKYSTLLEYIERTYDSLFDRTTAENQINMLYDVMNNFPELAKKYSSVVDKLKRYWAGELHLQQDPKYLVKNGKIIDPVTKAERVAVDEITPFWNEVKQMNYDIKRAVNKYNEQVTQGIIKGDGVRTISYNTVTLWDPVRDQQEFRKLIRRATDENAKHAFYNLFNLTPEEFVTELAYRKRFITFEEDDIADPQLKAMYNKFNKDAKRKLISAKDAPVKVYASDNGVYSIHDTVNHRYWFVLGKDRDVSMSGKQVYLDSNPVMRLQKPKQFNELAAADRFLKDPNNPGLAKTLNEFDNDFEKLTGARLGDSQGEYLAQEHLEKIYLQMPKEVQDLLPPLQEWSDKQFFEGYLFNESILGSMRSKQHLGMYSSDLLINMGHAITHAQAYIKPRSEYVNAAFDSMLSISSPNSVWNNFTDQELMEGLILNPDYKLVVLVDDKKYGMKTREILPTSVEAIQKARKLGAVIMPTQTYKDMYNVVNHRLGSTGFAKIWSRIMYAFKSGYLVRLGAMIRNTIDTQLKSRLAMGDEYAEYSKRAKGILADVKGLKDNLRTIQKTRYEQALAEYGPLAQKLFDDKDRIEKYVQRRAKDGFIREDAIKAWFEEGNAKYLTYDMYKELNSSFLNEGIAGNIMTDLYQSTNPGLWETYTQLTGNIVDMGNKIESYDRLAMYLYELDHGADYSSALARIAKTHFDYSFKTKAEQLAEMVFPFTTFALRNYSYWIEMLEKHPWIMRNYAHIMATHWDFSDYTPEELARDRRVQSQILYGQLKLGEYNDKVITFKANPSIQSAIQMFSDPINAVYENLAAPFAETIKAAQGQRTNINNVLPLIGPAIQSAQTMVKTGSPAPSVIGVSPKPRRTGKTIKFSNSNLSGANKYTDSTYRTPKYRNNAVYDSYKTKGITRYRLNMYPVVDIAHEIKMRYSINVYNRIKNRIRTDVYSDVRNRIRTDTNRFR